jgi:flagellar biosynthesis protein FlhF
LVKEIAGRIRVRDALCVGGKSPTVVALVGPTGVGKTSTIAKIAVDMVYKRNLNVGIINEDARRPGAEAQLLNLSQLLGIKVCAAETSERVESEMSRMRDMDLVLIDTTGRGPRDKEGISELSGYLEAVNPDETHLLISADISERSGLEVTRSFRKIDYTHLAISKMDEAASFGVIVSLAAATGQGLGFLTRGREYMESVIPANPAALAGLMLGSPSSGNRGEC